ncbi:MAG: glucose 1-dehydrogenase [Actinomycetota bacterium]|nr:glucose 1-dehydrogenase [Actinomycetota bacterium]
MKALTVTPGQVQSAQLRDVPEPSESDGPVLVEGIAVGICGTDVEIVNAEYGDAPPGVDYLVLGHENLGRVLEDPTGTFSAGDLIVGIVRRPDPVPCANCAAGEWDMCRNGEYTERGIKARHGYCSQRWRIEPEFAVRLPADTEDVGMLLEPTTVVAKAWEHVERIGSRAVFSPRTVLVTGAGPIGLLAALLGVQRGLAVHVLDQVTDGPKPDLVHDLGATYHSGSVDDLELQPDIVIECTGVPAVVFAAMHHNGRDGIVCLTGVSSLGRTLSIDIGALNREIVLENDVIFGSVNANRRHYEQGVDALAKADRSWLQRLVTRRVPLDRFAEALDRRPGDIKTVIELSG